MNNNSSNSILSLLVIGAIGVGIGILIAPDKGEETRKKIKNKLKEGEDKIKDGFAEFLNSIQDKITSIENGIINKTKKGDDDIEETNKLIDSLEKKLALLKKEVNK